MNKPKTLEAALAEYGTEKEKAFFANTELLNQLEPDELAYKKLKVCARAWNTDEDGKLWEPNWSDYNEYKYYPWLRVDASEENPAGVGFSSTDYDIDGSASRIGSRLCFQNSETAMEFADTFAELYKVFWLIPKAQ
jgi:hypothetical protein